MALSSHFLKNAGIFNYNHLRNLELKKISRRYFCIRHYLLTCFNTLSWHRQQKFSRLLFSYLVRILLLPKCTFRSGDNHLMIITGSSIFCNTSSWRFHQKLLRIFSLVRIFPRSSSIALLFLAFPTPFRD